MVTKLFRKLATSLGLIQNKQDSIELWVIPDHGTSFTQKFTLSSEEDLTMLRALPSTLAVMISEEDLQKLRRAGLAHLLCEWLECDVSYTPQQLELNLMTYHNAEEV